MSKINAFKDTFKTIVLAGLFAIVFRTFLYEPFNIPSGSMMPNLLVGDYLFVSKFSYGFSKFSLPFGLSPPIIPERIFFTSPKAGDVVVFRLPIDNKTDYIKRIVGLPGDTVSLKNGILHINGSAVDRKKVGKRTFDRTVDGKIYKEISFLYIETLPNRRSYEIIERSDNEILDETKEFIVPADHYFALGDNRDNSNDSRRIVGFIPSENLIGKAQIIFYSHSGKAKIWEIWKWPITVRYMRLWKSIT